MRRTHTLAAAAAAAIAVAVAGCSEGSGPDTGGVKPPAELTIIRLPAASAPIWNPVDSFWARKGEDRELRIYFVDPESGGPGEEYLRLRVDAPSLQAYPDGTPIAVGDSVLITVRVVDPQEIQFEFSPAGLTFNPDEPAELKIEYAEAEGDLDDDGDVDTDDDAIEQVIAMWKQEQVGGDYVRIGGVTFEELDEIEAEILGFTRYAIAY